MNVELAWVDCIECVAERILFFWLWSCAIELAQLFSNCCTFSYHVLWSLALWIEPFARLSVCGWAQCLIHRWGSVSLEWTWELCSLLPKSDLKSGWVKYTENLKSQHQTAGRHRCFTDKLTHIQNKTAEDPFHCIVPTFGFSVSSCWWWVSFLWRTSECFSRLDWGRQLTLSLRDSAAAKRLDSADTHWSRESSKRTMTEKYMSRALELLRGEVFSQYRQWTEFRHTKWNMQMFRRKDTSMLTLKCCSCFTPSQYALSSYKKKIQNPILKHKSMLSVLII